MDDEDLTDEQKKRLLARASWAAIDLLERNPQDVIASASRGLSDMEAGFMMHALLGRMVQVTKAVVEAQRGLVQLVNETLADLAMDSGRRPYTLPDSERGGSGNG